LYYWSRLRLSRVAEEEAAVEEGGEVLLEAGEILAAEGMAA
jgi:hypothetical protein